MKPFVAFDFETHRFADGIKAPPPVCAGVARKVGEGRFMLKPEALDELEVILKSNEVLAGANVCFDTVAACAERPSLLDLVFDKYERGEVFDVLIAASLDAIAKGHFCMDPLTRGKMLKPPDENGKQTQTTFYSLGLCIFQTFGRTDAKAADVYKKRYHEFENLPLAQWPPEATKYPCDDASNTLELALFQSKNFENLHFMEREAYAAFALQLATVHGLRTDSEAVDVLEAKLLERLAKAKARFAHLFDEEDGKKDTVALKKLVALAYGADPQSKCSVCQGEGKISSDKTGNPVQCKKCSATGLQLAPGTPRTPPSKTNPYGGLSANRDALAESGDDVLEGFAGVSETQTGLSRYVSFLRSGTDKPLCVDFNVVGAETDRTSANGVIQQIPRKGGFRECIVPREGYVFCSVDFSAVELSTFSECLLEVVGWSRMAEAINAGFDLHTKFAADSFMHLPYGKAKELVDAGDAAALNYRYMTKAGNFGFGGLMGGCKFAIAKRKEGLRLCITAGAAPECPNCRGTPGDEECPRCYARGFLCGLKKVIEWGKRDPYRIPPTCLSCIETGVDLRSRWEEQWPETREWFAWVKSQIDPVHRVINMRTPLTDFLRANMIASQASNHPFQHLAAVAGKEALKLISRACYVDRKSALYGSRIAMWVHDESILEIPEDRAHEGGFEQARLMVLAAKKVVKRVDVKAEPALMRRLYKEAKPRFDERKRLIPWEPKVA